MMNSQKLIMLWSIKKYICQLPQDRKEYIDKKQVALRKYRLKIMSYDENVLPVLKHGKHDKVHLQL